METTEAKAWAQEEFGDAQLGDARRTARLVAIGSGVAARPGGRVTSVFGTGAERIVAPVDVLIGMGAPSSLGR